MANSEPTAERVAPVMLIRAVRHLLRPLVRTLLAHQVTHPMLTRLLKTLYVDIAEGEFALPGQRQTDSRLSLITGIHRKEIRRLREATPADYAPPTAVSLGARLVARWTGSPEFVNAEGRPRELRRLGRSPDALGFEDLVASVSTDIRPRAVLDEWLRLGVVELGPDETVRLAVDAFVPRKGFDEKAHYFGRNLHDHMATASHNLKGEGEPLLERSVYYDRLSPESVRELAELSEREAMRSLQAVNRRALELQQRDTRVSDASRRMTFGTYFFEAEVSEPREESEEDE